MLTYLEALGGAYSALYLYEKQANAGQHGDARDDTFLPLVSCAVLGKHLDISELQDLTYRMGIVIRTLLGLLIELNYIF